MTVVYTITFWDNLRCHYISLFHAPWQKWPNRLSYLLILIILGWNVLQSQAFIESDIPVQITTCLLCIVMSALLWYGFCLLSLIPVALSTYRQERFETSITISEHSIIDITGYKKIESTFEDILYVFSNKKAIHLYSTGNMVLPIPRMAFASKDEENRFISLLLSGVDKNIINYRG